ncbi:MAG: hypothetical protein WC505_07560 [Patescibacteria group bacterium]
MSSTRRGGQRSPADNYPTPAWCCRRIIEAIPELPAGRWLEPCAGNGGLIAAVSDLRQDIVWDAVEIRSECCEGIHATGRVETVVTGDFLEFVAAEQQLQRYAVVMTNPPYSTAEQFLLSSFSIADHVVMLLRLNFIASARRSKIMRDHPPDVYVLPNRPSFSGHGTDSIEYAWFHWDNNRERQGNISVLPNSSLAERRSLPLAKE